MIELLFFWLLVIVASIILAKVEIQIEGAEGYAKNLPVSWRTDNKWARLFFTGTSYHLYQGLFLLLMIQLPIVLLVFLPITLSLSLVVGIELLALSFLTFVTVLEDFSWFALNKAWGEKVGATDSIIGRIKKYKPENIPWFTDRWFLVPSWYWWYFPAGIALLVGGLLLL